MAPCRCIHCHHSMHTSGTIRPILSPILSYTPTLHPILPHSDTLSQPTLTPSFNPLSPPSSPLSTHSLLPLPTLSHPFHPSPPFTPPFHPPPSPLTFHPPPFPHLLTPSPFHPSPSPQACIEYTIHEQPETRLEELINELGILPLSDTLRRAAQTHADAEGYLVVVLATSGYIDMLANFLCSATAPPVNNNHILVITPNHDIAEVARHFGVGSYMPPPPQPVVPPPPSTGKIHR